MAFASFPIKDANDQTLGFGTYEDVNAAKAFLHVLASLVNGTAQPASSDFPLPVQFAGGTTAVSGSGTITLGGTAQTLFSGNIPVHGFMIANNSNGTLYWNDSGNASDAGGSYPLPTTSPVFVSPLGYKPIGVISIYGGTTAQAFFARRW